MIIEVQPRKYLGEMPNLNQSKQDRVFNKAHLKAYLKGKRLFNHGMKLKTPVQHMVLSQSRILETK